jgi:hypothetical protein
MYIKQGIAVVNPSLSLQMGFENQPNGLFVDRHGRLVAWI